MRINTEQNNKMGHSIWPTRRVLSRLCKSKDWFWTLNRRVQTEETNGMKIKIKIEEDQQVGEERIEEANEQNEGM